jgi:hypothetical protein
MLAEMREHPGGSVQDVAMQRAESCWLMVERNSHGSRKDAKTQRDGAKSAELLVLYALALPRRTPHPRPLSPKRGEGRWKWMELLLAVILGFRSHKATGEQTATRVLAPLGLTKTSTTRSVVPLFASCSSLNPQPSTLNPDHPTAVWSLVSGLRCRRSGATSLTSNRG